MSIFKRKSKETVVVAPVVVVDVDKALDEVRGQLETLGDAWLRDRSLTFAQSLLTAVGEDPTTPLTIGGVSLARIDQGV